MTGTWVNTLSEADVAQAKMALAEMRKQSRGRTPPSESPRRAEQTGNQLLSDAIGILEKTVEAKKSTAD